MSVDKFGRYSSGQSSAMTPGASARYVNNNFLRRDGSNDVQGELNMNNHKLVGLTEPTESQDAAKMTLKDGYGFGGFSRAPPSKQHLSTPPPPPPGRQGVISRILRGTIS